MLVRIHAMLGDILPASDRAAGSRNDGAIAEHLAALPLGSVRAPTLTISTRDDGYGAHASALYTASRIAGAKFIGFETGGHTWGGHDDEVMAAISDLLSTINGETRP